MADDHLAPHVGHLVHADGLYPTMQPRQELHLRQGNEMTTAYKCNKCQDTGMTEGSAFLDCVHCDAVERRNKFQGWLEEAGLLPEKEFMLDIAWQSYLKGGRDKEEELTHAK